MRLMSIVGVSVFCAAKTGNTDGRVSVSHKGLHGKASGYGN
jgi:hypothetical protein